MTEFENNCYGCDPKEYLESAKNSLSYKFSGKNMVIFSILSDAQELIAMGAGEKARKEINLAKYLLEYLEEK